MSIASNLLTSLFLSLSMLWYSPFSSLSIKAIFNVFFLYLSIEHIPINCFTSHWMTYFFGNDRENHTIFTSLSLKVTYKFSILFNQIIVIIMLDCVNKVQRFHDTFLNCLIIFYTQMILRWQQMVLTRTKLLKTPNDTSMNWIRAKHNEDVY